MATVDELKVLITAETKQLRMGLDSVNQKLKKTETQTKKVSKSFSGMGKVIGALGLGLVGREIVNTSRTFEDLEATLRAITGSAENAAVSMDLIRAFTSGTTFQLENVSQAFTTLLNAGITPTSDTMKDFGNIAAAFGKDITQIAQATFNATTGEMEMLKQFGIKAKLEGDKIKMIFREQETEIDRDSTAIVGYLRGIAQENFDTALEERLNTVSGVFSNLKDAVSEVFNAIGEGGLNTILKDTGKALIAIATAAKVPAQIIGTLLVNAFNGLKMVVKVVADNIGTLIVILGIYVGYKAPIIVTMAFSKAMFILTKSITAARVALTLLARNPIVVGLTLITLGVGMATDKFEELSAKAKEVLEKFGVQMFPFLKDDKKDIDELNAAVEEFMSKMVDDIPPAIDGTKAALGDMKEAVIQSANAFTKDFVDSLLEGESALESFKNFSKNIVSQIIAIFMQMAVVNKILNAIFNAGLPEINIGGAGLGTNQNVIGTNNIDTSNYVAGGGKVQGGTPYMVGERGAEIFVPNTGGTIMNNMNSKNAMGGSPIIVNQSVNFATGVVPTVRAEVQKMLPQISDVTKGAVLEAAVRGGSFRKGLLGSG